MMIKSVLIVYNSEHVVKLLPDVESILKAKNIRYAVVDRDDIEEGIYSGKDMVLVIGGDGTFLRASHLNKDIPMFGINPNPDTKEGFYMRASSKDFRQKLPAILAGNYKIIKLLRLQVKINQEKLREKVLNEVYIGDSKPYTVFNYNIRINEVSEFQRGSGMLVGTPSGSSAWIMSAGGKKINMDDKKFQFLARELYEGRHTKDYRLKHVMLDNGSRLLIEPKTKGIVVIDSLSQEYECMIGDKIEVSADNDLLNYVIP